MHVAAIARNPNTTITAMAHRGKALSSGSPCRLPLGNAAVPVKVVGVPFMVVILVAESDARLREASDAWDADDREAARADEDDAATADEDDIDAATESRYVVSEQNSSEDGRRLMGARGTHGRH
jgi:hypothetical protein